MSFLRRFEDGSEVSKSASTQDQEFKKGFPALHEFLTCEQYPDGTPRTRSTLSVFHEDGLWKACLNERDQGLVLFVAEERYGTLLEALELLLQEDRPPWRKSKSKGPSGPRTKGKGT